MPTDERLLTAARACFRRDGARRVTMEQVARAASTSRQNLYRSFSTRDQLVEAAIVARIEEIAQAIPHDSHRRWSFSRAITDLSVATVEAARADAELQDLFSAAGEMRLHEVLAGPHPAVERIVTEFWQPWFDKARTAGEMRTDITDAQAVEWIRGVYLMLILRADMTPKRARTLLSRFLVPALVVPT